jgi:iron complex outermembrane receptor protein
MKQSRSRGKILLGLLTTCAALGVGGTTIAAAAPQNTAPAAALDEIVVTAQFKRENLQTVPLAITAIQGSAIAKAGITDMSGIAQRVPGLTFSPFSPGQNIISLRGISSNDDGAGTDNSVAVFVDGVYMGRVSNVNPDIFDLEDVEVLRGPQGTLRGKNTIGGAILYRTRKPDHDEFEGKVSATYGRFNDREVSGYITGPVTDHWAVKVAGSLRARDGWVHNVLLNTTEKNDDTKSVRGQASYESDRLSALFSADYSKLDVDDMGRIPLAASPDAHGLDFAVSQYQSYCGTSVNPSCATNPVKGYTKREAYGGSAQFDLNLDFAKLTSITAYRKSKADWLMDSTGAPGLPIGDLINDVTKQFTQETRLAGGSGPISYIAGLWYSNEKTNRLEAFEMSTPE